MEHKNGMEHYPFIFSDKLKYRLRRHLAFWGFWWIFLGVLYSFLGMNPQYNYWWYLLDSTIESAAFLPIHIFLSYSLIYFVLPHYLLRQKYWQTVLWVLALFLMTAGLSVLISTTLISTVRYNMLGEHSWPMPVSIGIVCRAMMAGLRGGITIGGFAATIKLMKYWYTKERKNLQLQKENAEAQLQLLKAQVHPHFLFNTLNNIYSFTQNTSTVASKLVMGLSDMLRYMLYECNQPLVTLDKELKMLRDYCTLEQIRYDNQLDLHIELPQDVQDLHIAPLLLLPFVENCFKHGASNMLEQPWISLHVSVEGDTLKMNLVNGKPPDPGNKPLHKPGIGIVNVRKRLSLLYPDKHQLLITSEEEVFIVNLTLDLERKIVPPAKSPLRTAPKQYA
ncbi:MAG TPA: histidine kinase [Chitinophagaceae bacterium]|nr:histidine kinase [Chitinophagaceae bacterium]